MKSNYLVIIPTDVTPQFLSLETYPLLTDKVSFFQFIAQIRCSVFFDYCNLDTKTGYEEIRWTFPDQKIERRMERGQITKRIEKVTDNFHCFILPLIKIFFFFFFFFFNCLLKLYNTTYTTYNTTELITLLTVQDKILTIHCNYYKESVLNNL